METVSGRGVQTNESKIRLTAFFVMLLAIVYFTTGALVVPVFLSIDFLLRSVNLSRFSPLAALSGWIVSAVKLFTRPVYLPPKRFAARIGLGFCVLIIVLHFFGVSALVPVSVLVLFAALESFANFCAGCYVYDWIVSFRK